MADSMIDINYLKQLLEIFDESTVNDLRIEQEGVSIKLSKTPKKDGETSALSTYQYPPMPVPMQMPQQQTMESAAAPAAPAQPAEPKQEDVESGKKYHEVRSPIVGTFYRSPSPDAPSFVEPGQAVSPGMVLCIIEAMKLMNEIECDTYGKVAKVLVENAQPVEYNQVLFLVEPE
jgi:acetyl-CoA carboxylase biotin carboxyl carrier protein